jgi:hypothetical protein
MFWLWALAKLHFPAGTEKYSEKPQPVSRAKLKLETSWRQNRTDKIWITTFSDRTRLESCTLCSTLKFQRRCSRITGGAVSIWLRRSPRLKETVDLYRSYSKGVTNERMVLKTTVIFKAIVAMRSEVIVSQQLSRFPTIATMCSVNYLDSHCYNNVLQK